MLGAGNILFIYCAGFLKKNNCNSYIPELTEWLATLDYQFSGLLQLSSINSTIKMGDALYVY